MEFAIELYHGGVFKNEPILHYDGGDVKHIYDCDSDRMSMPELLDHVRDLGYIECKGLWYRIPGIEIHRGLKLLKGDQDVMEMCLLVASCRIVDMYVEHYIDRPDPNDIICDKPLLENTVNVEFEHEFGEDEGEVPVEVYENVDRDYEGVVEEARNSDGGDKCVSEDDINFVEEVDEVYDDSEIDDDPFDCKNVEMHSDYGKSDELESLYGSSDEERRINKKNDKEGEVPRPKGGKGLYLFKKYATPRSFKDEVKLIAIKGGCRVRFIKNTRDRVQAKCSKGCKWHVWASWMQNERTFQIKTLYDVHTCTRTHINPLANSRWLSKRFIKKFMKNPDIKVKDFCQAVNDKYSIKVSRSQGYRTKVKAIELLEGSLKKQYNKLQDYAKELLRTNPGSTVKIKCLTSPELDALPQFQRIYICFDALKKGFLEGCRPFIGIDACFLKGYYGGQLIAATAVDGNNMMFPIAYAVVEGETKDAWVWFLELLGDDLNIGSGNGYTFMSDQQKGLVPACDQVFPNGEHRFCMRHLYANYNKDFKGGKEVKELLWACAYASTFPEHETAMKNLEEAAEDGYAWMREKPAKYWTRAAFSSISKCDLLVNNISESFNSFILETRDKPIITMLELIREGLMERIQKMRALMMSYEGPICPAIQTKVEGLKMRSGCFVSKWNGGTSYQVNLYLDKYTVDIGVRTCSCRRWDLTGIPCAHAISVIFYMNHVVEDYVHDYYKTETFMKAYGHFIMPCNGEKLWEASGCPPIQPPILKREPGRPPKRRIRGGNEPTNPYKVSKKNTVIKCSRCLQPGHNKTTCKGPVTLRPVRNGGGRGRNAGGRGIGRDSGGSGPGGGRGSGRDGGGRGTSGGRGTGTIRGSGRDSGGRGTSGGRGRGKDGASSSSSQVRKRNEGGVSANQGTHGSYGATFMPQPPCTPLYPPTTFLWGTSSGTSQQGISHSAQVVTQASGGAPIGTLSTGGSQIGTQSSQTQPSKPKAYPSTTLNWQGRPCITSQSLQEKSKRYRPNSK